MNHNQKFWSNCKSLSKFKFKSKSISYWVGRARSISEHSFVSNQSLYWVHAKKMSEEVKNWPAYKLNAVKLKS